MAMQSIVASDGRIDTSNAPITGTFHSDGSLVLTTSNAPIDITTYIDNDPESGKENRLVARTSNGQVLFPHHQKC